MSTFHREAGFSGASLDRHLAGGGEVGAVLPTAEGVELQQLELRGREALHTEEVVVGQVAVEASLAPPSRSNVLMVVMSMTTVAALMSRPFSTVRSPLLMVMSPLWAPVTFLPSQVTVLALALTG